MAYTSSPKKRRKYETVIEQSSDGTRSRNLCCIQDGDLFGTLVNG